MKVTEPIDVYLADKLFQLTTNDLPPPRTDEELPAALAGRTMVVFGGSYGIGADIAELAAAYGADVHHVQPFEHQHPRRAARATSPRPARRCSPRPAGSTTSSTPRACCPAATLVDTSRGDDLRRHRDQLPRAGAHRPGVPPPPGRDQRQPAAFTSSSYTRGRSGYSLYSSAKAAVVNLTQALADEWAERRRPGQLHQPRAHRHPDAHQGLRRGAAGSLLDGRWPGPRSTCCSSSHRPHHRPAQADPLSGGVDKDDFAAAADALDEDPPVSDDPDDTEHAPAPSFARPEPVEGTGSTTSRGWRVAA